MPKTQGHTLTYETRHYMDALASTTSIQHTMAQRHALPQHTRQYTETHRHTHSRLDHNALVAHVVSIPEDADLAANPNHPSPRDWKFTHVYKRQHPIMFAIQSRYTTPCMYAYKYKSL